MWRYRLLRIGSALWSWQGRRFFLYIGLPDTKPNRKAANIKAETIELDMTSGNFDPLLAKYKPQAESEAISVVEMFDRFTQQKQRTISIGPLAKYLSLQKHVLAFFKGKTSVSVSFIYCRKVSSLFDAEAWTRFRLNRKRIETIRTQLNQLRT